MDEAADDVLAYMTFHPDHWARTSSTNPLERLIGEIKRRTGRRGHLFERGRDCLPGRERLLEQNDESAAGRCWLSFETLAAFGHNNQLRLPTVAA
jgi:putative transposase